MYINIDKKGNIYLYESFRTGSKTSSRKVDKLGRLDDIMKENSWTEEQARAWAKEQARIRTQEHKEDAGSVYISFNKNKDIPAGVTSTRHVGYLFLQSIYYSLGLDSICDSISAGSRAKFSVNDILRCLVFNRILEPSSKLRAWHLAKDYPEAWNFSKDDIYRAMDILSDHMDPILSQLYRSSNSILDRDTSVLYYDCSNFHFEVEWADSDGGLRQYGIAKNHMPNPLVQVGMWSDRNGIPFSMNVNKGNQNEQLSINKETFESIKRDYGVSRFIYCADAGLGSAAIKKALNAFLVPNAYIVTQSIKKMREEDRNWCISRDENAIWNYQKTDPHTGEIRTFQIYYKDIDQDKENSTVYYRDKWVITSDGREERLVVTYSPKYRNYLERLREEHLHRAMKKLLAARKDQKDLKAGKGKKKQKRPTDATRFIKETHLTKEGEEAGEVHYEIDEAKLAEEAKYDGFYCIATDLDDDITEILRINKGRQDIEASFRELKSGLLETRPIFHWTADRIRAHFLICFIALLIFRILQRAALNYEYTVDELCHTLRKMKLFDLHGQGWTPCFERTELTDKLMETFGFSLQKEFITPAKLNKAIRDSKKRKKISTFSTSFL